jgi:hypothetical protein
MSWQSAWEKVESVLLEQGTYYNTIYCIIRTSPFDATSSRGSLVKMDDPVFFSYQI